MKHPELGSMSEASYRHGKDRDREKAIKQDKQKIEDALNSNDAETMRTVHMEIDGKYGAYVPDWNRLRCALKVGSSITPEAKTNFNQPSVSAHSLRAISNLECISARL